ncbi:MAG TPA: prepilin-type N-terminal cleavage/methylation domain-containing protein [Pyrinomonadaceae bacterium]|nr:prepilin-type N-terminal cleavage/methylation domain-containing protein [Pyrinomonadaceae bacterium]
MEHSLKENSHVQAGVSVIELLVVMIVIGVIAGFALMQRGGVDVQISRQNVAQQLKVAFERARFNSVKRRAQAGQEATVTVTPTSYTLRTYAEVSGAWVASDQTVNLPSGIVIGLYDESALTTRDVPFNMRGETPASPSPEFLVCNVTCANRTNATANIVLVTPTGTVNLLPGGSSLPVFGVPSVTSVPGSNGINPDTVLP